MSTTECPSPYRIMAYYEQEVEEALTENPEITLNDLIHNWDEKNSVRHNYMKRPEPVEYCTECHRIYEVQAKGQGYWLRVFQMTEPDSVEEVTNDWKKIYVFTDVDTDAATEKDIDVGLYRYLQDYMKTGYYLSFNETQAVGIDMTNREVTACYKLEDIYCSEEVKEIR